MVKLISIFLKSAGVTIDSRQAEGKMFFALRGAKDGNQFASSALDNGAVCAVVDDAAVVDDERMILVDDVLTALQTMARVHREGLGIPIIALTGSNGKTTTKELMTAVLRRKYRVTATVGNLNNHIGVPLTLLAMTSETELGIVEMGANHQGEIKLLCEIAEPNYGLITNVGRAHLEGFGGEDGVRKGKGELYDYLVQHHGTAIVRSDDAVLSVLAGEREGLDTVWYEDSNHWSGLNSQLTGNYNRYNMVAAAAVGSYFGVAESDIRDAIAKYVPSNMRSQRIETENNTTIIADCYNANPSSMSSALDSFSWMDDGRAKLAILGDMLELGEWSEQEHRKVMEQAQSIGEVWLVGNNFAAIQSDNPTFRNVEEVAAYIADNPLRDRLVLIKGSHGISLDKLIGI